MMLSEDPVMPVLPVSDPQRAAGFYRKRLGLEVHAAGLGSEDLIVECGEGTCIVLHPVPEHPTTDHTAAGFRVDDIEATIEALEANGVSFEDYDLPGLKTEDHIAEGPGVRSAWFHDSEGNLLCLDEFQD